MGQPVDANGRSILHKGHGMQHTCAVPDVCKTPSPAGPVPIPYVNIAMDSNLTDGADSVQIEGNPVATVNANISTSMGDEPGTAGGILSSKFKGTMTWKMGSLDVKAEGASVVRFLDSTFHNGNSFNASFKNLGGTGVAYADDFQGRCPVCDKGPQDHRILEKGEAEKSSAKLCAALVEKLKSEFSSASSDADKLKIARQNNDGTWRGYMVGVMICPCDTSFAAMSGRNVDDFESIATKVVDKAIPGGWASSAEYVSANTSGLPGVKDAIEGRIGALATKIRQDPKRYNPVGSCAGAKLLAKSGHKPVQMTEMFFSPPGARWKGATYKWLQRNKALKVLGEYGKAYRNKIMQNKASKEKDREFGEGETVGSCQTCQELLFLTMCPTRKCGGT
jgi:Toxin PAAR-like domain